MSIVVNFPQSRNARFDKDPQGGHDANGGNEPPTMPPTDYLTHKEFQEVRTEINERFARVEARLDQTASKADLSDMKAELIKWIVGAAIGLGAAGITVMTFVLNNATPKGPTAQQQPIIINVPAPHQPVVLAPK